MNPAAEMREWSCPECGEDISGPECSSCGWEAAEPDFAGIVAERASEEAMAARHREP